MTPPLPPGAAAGPSAHDPFAPVPAERGLYCNRTLNMRSLRAIGYDMDYTLIHYDVPRWEARAYAYTLEKLGAAGMPVDGLEFQPDLMIRGLIVDTELGNIVKANRFGFVRQAYHGLRPMGFDEVRDTYRRTIVDLAESRFVFLNTLFSHSEMCLYAQLVQRLDDGRVPGVLGYADLYKRVKALLDETHMEGRLKSEIVADPERYVDVDPDLPQTLLDQRGAGKKLLLITNSEWNYTRAIMSFAFDRFLPRGMGWRALFDVVIVQSQKPAFFTDTPRLFRVVDEERGLLEPVIGGLQAGAVHLGGHARLVEEHLGLKGDEILYVGDHIFTDVKVSGKVLRWRTALIVRELEEEIAANRAFRASQAQLDAMMEEKEALEHRFSVLRVQQQRARDGFGDTSALTAESGREMSALREELRALDERIAPLATAGGSLGHAGWGAMLRAGNDKSHLARQIERAADVYTSRVSNFGRATPYAYLRSRRGTLPHDDRLASEG